MYHALGLYPKRLILSGCSMTSKSDEIVQNGHMRERLTKDLRFSMFCRLVQSGQAFVSTLSNQHRVGGVLKKLSELIFNAPLGREGSLSFKEVPQHLQILQKIIGRLIFFDLAYLKEIGRGDGRSRWKDNEEVYFVAGLLGHLSFAIRKYVRSISQGNIDQEMSKSQRKIQN